MQIEYIGKREPLKVTFTRFPYTFRPGEVTEVDDPDDQQTLLAYPTSFVRVLLPEGPPGGEDLTATTKKKKKGTPE